MDVCDKLYDFYQKFKGEKGIIGQTLLNRPIFYFNVKKTDKPIIIAQYGIHAREYITTLLALKHIEEFKNNHIKGNVFFIPAVNVDGIKIAQRLLPQYKANARGVDLNVNFPAKFGCGEKNQKQKGCENFIGKFAFSEPETRALKNFTELIRPNITLSFHSKGEEIYYEFFQEQKQKEKHFKIASAVSKCTGYKIKSTPNSSGGYKDWCITKLKIPSLTIEVGDDTLAHPLKEECLEEIFNKTKDVLKVVINSLQRE